MIRRKWSMLQGSREYEELADKVCRAVAKHNIELEDIWGLFKGCMSRIVLGDFQELLPPDESEGSSRVNR